MTITYKDMIPGQLYEFSLDMSVVQTEIRKYIGIYIGPDNISYDNIIILCGSEVKCLRNYSWSARKL